MIKYIALIALLTLNAFAAQQVINNGSYQTDPNAERAYTAFNKVNANFTELYAFKTNATNVGYVNIKDFGAVSGADSTLAISNAFLRGQDVYVPSGTYLISSQLVLPTKVKIFGDGPSSVLQADANLSYRSMFYGNDVNAKFENLAFVGNGVYNHSYSYPTNHAFIYTSNSIVAFNGLTITNQVNGIMSEWPKELLVEKCNFQRPNTFGDERTT